MSPAYDPTADYRLYKVTDGDGRMLSTGEAAQGLNLRTTQGVRSLIAAGRLPSTRVGRKTLVPEWAVLGRRQHRSWTQPDVAPSDNALDDLRARARALESALLTLRTAEEHARRARAYQEDALREWIAAYDVLHEAVGAVVIPQSPLES